MMKNQKKEAIINVVNVVNLKKDILVQKYLVQINIDLRICPLNI